MEQAIRNILTAAVHKVKAKTYDVDPIDPVQAFLDDLFAELFPSAAAPASVEEIVIPTLPVQEQPAEPAKERKKPGPKPKVDEQGNPIKKERKKKKTEGHVHIDKLTSFEVNKLKVIAPDFDKKAFLAHINSLEKEEFDSKTLEDHLRSFVEAPAAAVELEVKEETNMIEHECIEVLFNDNVYYVDPVTKRVYEPQGEANVAVGYVGMAAFKEMPMPDNDS